MPLNAIQRGYLQQNFNQPVGIVGAWVGGQGNDNHLQLVQQVTQQLREDLESIKFIDKFFGPSLVGVGGGFALSWIPFVSGIAAASSLVAIISSYKRGAQMELYTQSLDEVIEVYRWCFKDNTRAALRVPEVQQLALALGPLLDGAEFKKWDDADLEVNPVRQVGEFFGVVDAAMPEAMRLNLVRYALGEQTGTIDYKLYGHGPGLDVGAAIQQGVSAVREGLTRMVFMPRGDHAD